MPTSIAPINTKDDSLEVVGGKGRSLAKLANAGFDVPGGFQVTTSAYRGYVAEHGLQQDIIKLARPAVVDGRASFDASSQNIQKLFAERSLSADITTQIRDAYATLPDEPAVAVRSSANAEDLPGLSFAGQQETFLNVRGADEVVAAVRNCWASLWTSQAISYRHQNGIDQNMVAMAVVVQIMVPSEVSGILFTANPASGERNEMIINASFGLGEAVVSGQVTPDTYIVDKTAKKVSETMIGPKTQQIVADGAQGTRLEDVAASAQGESSLTDDMLKVLIETALRIEALYELLPQDIEWAFSEGKLHLLQSRPITDLPVQPVELIWEPVPPAKIIYRRQIVENMPDPICPLFEEIYLTNGLQSGLGENFSKLMEGALFVTCNGFAFQRADWKGGNSDFNDPDAVGPEAEKRHWANVTRMKNEAAAKTGHLEVKDMALFRGELEPEERAAFDEMAAAYTGDNLAHELTLPPSQNPTYIANNKVDSNNERIEIWRNEAVTRLRAIADKCKALDVVNAQDDELLQAIVELGEAEGFYWTSSASHTFGIAKSTDDQLQCFLRETLPDHHFISGQFLSGVPSKTMQANADLFAIRNLVRKSPALTELVIVTPSRLLWEALKGHPDAGEVRAALAAYLENYGHMGYSLDFVEPTPWEDPSAMFATLRTMVADDNYDPKNQSIRATATREKSFKGVSELLEGLQYWQFRYRLWFGLRFAFIREETAFYFGYCWPTLRPIARELARRMVASGTFLTEDDTYYLTTSQLKDAIVARGEGRSLPELGALAASQRELREARKRHHPPGTIPAEASNLPGVKFKETQIQNSATGDTLTGFAVSSGRITGTASVIMSPAEFDKMQPGSILVSPLTTPAWTPLFSHAVGLVTDIGSILAHGSIVAREYGIPAVLGVGNGTQRIKHGQSITIDGDAGTVTIHDQE